MQTSKMQGEPGAWPVVITKIACATLKCERTHTHTNACTHYFPVLWFDSGSNAPKKNYLA